MLSRFSQVQLFVTLQTAAYRLLCPWGFSRQEYWSRFAMPSSRDLPNPGIEPMSVMSPALADGFVTTGPTWEAHNLT